MTDRPEDFEDRDIDLDRDGFMRSRVELEETIAEGHGGCRVVVHLSPEAAAKPSAGREYFRIDPRQAGA